MTDRPFQSAIAGKRPDLGSRAGFAASSVYRPPTYRECISGGGWLILPEKGRFSAIPADFRQGLGAALPKAEDTKGWRRLRCLAVNPADDHLPGRPR